MTLTHLLYRLCVFLRNNRVLGCPYCASLPANLAIRAIVPHLTKIYHLHLPLCVACEHVMYSHYISPVLDVFLSISIHMISKSSIQL